MKIRDFQTSFCKDTRNLWLEDIKKGRLFSWKMKLRCVFQTLRHQCSKVGSIFHNCVDFNCPCSMNWTLEINLKAVNSENKKEGKNKVGTGLKRRPKSQKEEKCSSGYLGPQQCHPQNSNLLYAISNCPAPWMMVFLHCRDRKKFFIF